MPLCFFQEHYPEAKDIPDWAIESARARKNYNLEGYAGKYWLGDKEIVVHVFLVDDETIGSLEESANIKFTKFED